MKSFSVVFLLSLTAVDAFVPHSNLAGRETLAQSKPSLVSANLFGFGKKKEEEGGVATLEPPKLESKTEIATIPAENVVDEECVIEEELSETDKLMKQIKDAGIAGFISYALWEWAFWIVSVPICVFGYRQLTGHWPDFSDSEDLKQVGAEAFAFVNFARFAVPLRIGLAISTTPFVQENLVDRFMKKDEDNCEPVE